MVVDGTGVAKPLHLSYVWRANAEVTLAFARAASSKTLIFYVETDSWLQAL